jgi:hypothetical protein
MNECRISNTGLLRRGRNAADLCRRFWFLGLAVAGSGCSGGASGTGVPAIAGSAEPQSVQSVQAPAATAALGRQGAGFRNARVSQALCVGGTTYQTSLDDEFSQDTTLNYTPNLLTTTPAPNGAVWSSRANGFASDHSRNNVGTDDAYYTDPSRGFGGYNPYSLSGGALNITAEPVPAPYATASPLLGAHWLSGLLESPALTYGYVEVSARIPNLQGWWPALWILGLAGDDGKGNGYEELDENELFGTALPKSTVQQTQIFSPSGQPPANFVRTVVSPDPSTVFHTYGVLWTAKNVRFYIDRIETSPAFANAANGPANAILNLSVFTDHTWAPPPANQTPQTMSLQYFRWYQSQGTSCSPTIVPTSQPTPTPTPKPAATGVPEIVQNSGVIAYENESTLLGRLGHAPPSGDVLVAYVDAWTPVATPQGWTRTDAPSNSGYFVFTGVVGKNGLPSSTTYSFGENWGIVNMLDITGASPSGAILVSADPDQWQPQFPRTLTIPAAHGLLLAGWGGFSYLANGFSAINDQLPTGQAEKILSYSLNNPVANYGSFSLRLTQMTSEPYSASPPFTIIGSIEATNWNFNGDLLWIPSAI